LIVLFYLKTKTFLLFFFPAKRQNLITQNVCL
jgi:hypothetical protein